MSQAVRKIGKYDFVFCGRQAIDGDTAQVGPQLAEKLGLPQITYFERLVDLSGRTVRIRRNVGNGWEVLEARLPVLVTVLDTANEPRPAAARRVMRYKRMRSAVELAGEVVGFQMGLNFAAFFDPAANAQTSAVARFFGQMAALLFVVLNGHLLVLMAVIRSFEVFPIDQSFLQAMQRLRLHELGAELFATGLWIALPMVGMLMFVNLALGIVSRVAPQMNIYAVGFPITLTVGLVGIAVTLPLLDQPFSALLERVIDIFSRH